jgi:tryptophan synthase alpha chain
VAAGARDLSARIRAITDLPIAMGFGLSRPEHVAEVCEYADAAVVGSALVSVVARAGERADLPERVEQYVSWLKGRADAPGATIA